MSDVTALSPDMLVRLFECLAQAHAYGFPDGSRGAAQNHERVRNPKVGDFVYVTMTMRGPWETMGLLAEKRIGDSRYTTEWCVHCLDGQPRKWSNVNVYALPVGSPFGTTDERFQVPLWLEFPVPVVDVEG